MMKEPQYLSCIEKSKENIFRQYLAALEEMGELSAEDEELKMSRLQKTGLLKRSPVFMLKLLQAQPFYPIPFLNRIQPLPLEYSSVSPQVVRSWLSRYL